MSSFVVGEAGLIAICAVGCWLIVKVAPGDEPPPGAGFCTTTLAVPAEATSVAEIEAVTLVALTN